MKRRDFLGWVGVGAIATSLPMAIAACSGTSQSTSTDDTTDNTSTAETTSPTTSETVATTDGFAELGTVTQLDEQGFLINTVSDTKVIAIRNPESPETVLALNALCTHKLCTVDWEAEGSEFNCACHGSKFALDGSATSGPATEPLANYETKIEGDRVLVNIG